ncbi:hypothetical protein FGB62_6g251 [Gracilaria domingensis]|nr:hypothetical protein FGB62_6g251 [Gracilaria domingensis]
MRCETMTTEEDAKKIAGRRQNAYPKWGDRRAAASGDDAPAAPRVAWCEPRTASSVANGQARRPAGGLDAADRRGARAAAAAAAARCARACGAGRTGSSAGTRRRSSFAAS